MANMLCSLVAYATINMYWLESCAGNCQAGALPNNIANKA